jgi:hypothetical protein
MMISQMMRSTQLLLLPGFGASGGQNEFRIRVDIK